MSLIIIFIFGIIFPIATIGIKNHIFPKAIYIDNPKIIEKLNLHTKFMIATVFEVLLIVAIVFISNNYTAIEMTKIITIANFILISIPYFYAYIKDKIKVDNFYKEILSCLNTSLFGIAAINILYVLVIFSLLYF